MLSTGLHKHATGQCLRSVKPCVAPSTRQCRAAPVKFAFAAGRQGASRLSPRAVQEALDGAAAAAPAGEQQDTAASSGTNDTDTDRLVKIRPDNTLAMKVGANTGTGTAASFIVRLLKEYPGLTVIVSSSGFEAPYQALRVVNRARELMEEQDAGTVCFRPNTVWAHPPGRTGPDGRRLRITITEYHVSLLPSTPVHPDVPLSSIAKVGAYTELEPMSSYVLSRLKESDYLKMRAIGGAAAMMAVSALARARHFSLLYLGTDVYAVVRKESERLPPQPASEGRPARDERDVLAMVLHVHKCEAREGVVEALRAEAAAKEARGAARGGDRRSREQREGDGRQRAEGGRGRGGTGGRDGGRGGRGGRGRGRGGRGQGEAVGAHGGAASGQQQEWQGMKQQLEEVAQSVSSLVSELQQQQQ